MLNPDALSQLVNGLTPEQKQEIVFAAQLFKNQARFTLPRIISGHPVAHASPEKSRITNFSTITRIVNILGGYQAFLIYRYPLSWIHSITDNLQRFITGKPCAKPFATETWQRIFEAKTLIPYIDIQVPGVVALPYIPNWNLHDVLHHRVVDFETKEIVDILDCVARDINCLHKRVVVWGEPIVHNIIVLEKPYGRVQICDTEVSYYPWVPFERQQMHDWFDFIFSACGSIHRLYYIDRQQLAAHLFMKIEDKEVRGLLARYCKRGLTLGQRLLWGAMSGRLSCSRENYEKIRQAIANINW